VSNSPASEPTLAEAPILHIDLDAFFASVEILDDPTLRGKPVCVGGAGDRGVVASASYEARRYGVRSAMPSAVARRLCPEMIMLPGRFDRYEEYSSKFHAIVNDVTPHYEPISLDEVFADLSGLTALQVTPLVAAQTIRTRLKDELLLECGIGVARNKLFAKLASKESKATVVNGRLVPGPGVVWVDPALEAKWLNELPVRALWGVGPATSAKLQQLGLPLIRDLLKVDEETLAYHFGPAMAATLSSYARGEDRREVEVNRAAKSLGHDQTFARSVIGASALAPHIRHHAGIVARALRSKDLVARTITTGVRFDDLSMVSRSQTLPFGVDDEEAIVAVVSALIDSIPLALPVRLLSVHASSLLERERNVVQLSFDVASGATGRDEAIERSRGTQVVNEGLRDVLDEIRGRFGTAAVGVASELSSDGLDVARQRGAHAFGPAPTDEQ